VNNYKDLPDIVLGRNEIRCMAGKASSVYEELGKRVRSTAPWTRSIKIAEGCSNNCSYCIIPSIRGRYRSRTEESIIAEAQQLAAEGCKELVIIAQDVTFYGNDLGKRDALPQLLDKLSNIDGIEWIRLMYCYEDEISDKLIETIRNNNKICKYIDIPLQHISSRVLKDMDRKSTSESIKSTITKLRTLIPDIAIRTTLICGFPGETKEDFQELFDFVRDTQFERLGAFAYSKEEGTKAALMKNQIRSDVKQRRWEKIMQLQRQIALKNNRKLIGKTLRVLVEDIEDDSTYIGRSYMDAPDIDDSVIFTSQTPLKPGDFADVYITDAFDYDITGKAVFNESTK